MDKKPYITITHGLRGYYAVHLYWNGDGFWEPWATGTGSYATQEEAEPEARRWALDEDVDFMPPSPKPN